MGTAEMLPLPGGFPKVKWLHLTGEVVKRQIFLGFHMSKIIKIG